MGFFAIPEIIDLGVQRSSIAKEHVKHIGGVMEGVKDTFRHWWLVIRCSAVGAFCAIIPGMGASVSQWLAYAQAQQSSKDKDSFGKGAIEGVLGPGAANNSSMGGGLITTVAFGVPASVLLAILVGAFLIQGIVPGPDMLIPEARGGHLGLTFSFVWIIVVSNIITVTICLLFLNQLVKITYVRGSVIIPIILLLIYLGTFAEKNAFADLILMLIFGDAGMGHAAPRLAAAALSSWDLSSVAWLKAGFSFRCRTTDSTGCCDRASWSSWRSPWPAPSTPLFVR